jgi:hypothetical protein
LLNMIIDSLAMLDVMVANVENKVNLTKTEVD